MSSVTHWQRRLVRNTLLVTALSVPLPALATNHSYIGPDGGFWNTPTNWAPNGVPVNGDAGFISAGNSDYTVNFNGNYAGSGLGFVGADSSGFGTGIIIQSGNAMVQSGGQMQIGYSGRGHYIQSGGTNSATDMFLGGIAGSVGTYDLSGSATFTVSDAADVGVSGSGSFNQSGGTFNPSLLNVGWSQPGGYGSYSMTGGAFNAGTVRVGGSGTGYFQQSGFSNVTVSSALQIQTNGNYTLSNGTLTAPLFNQQGTFYQSGGYFNVSGVNYSVLNVSGGNFIVTAGAYYNYALMNISGGAIISNGNAYNYGQISVNGSASLGGSAAFNNFGTINVNSGLLTLNGAGPLSSSGNINLAAGWGLILNSNLTNTGTLSLNGGQINGFGGTLINRSGGTVRGAGLISSPFDNQGGRLLLTDGTTNILQPFNTRGIIELASASASLTGGIITNTGQIFGHGSITNDINNSSGSSIEANGGNLILAGSVTNFGGGTMVADNGAKLFFPGGITTNSGLINLQGGTFDNNGIPINNTGQMSGFGTIRTGGLANNGSVTLTGGFTTVNGAVVNSAAHQFKVAYDPALFTGAVINNGTFKSTSTTITFSGSYTENGTFISDPSDTYFFDVFLNAPGSWTGGIGDRFFVKGVLDWSGGSMTGAGAQTFNQGSATLHDANVKTLNGWTFNNEKPLTLSGGNIDMGNGGTINNTNTFDIQSDAGITNTLGGSATFINTNILRKSAGAGTSPIAALVANNNGNIDVQSGTLSLTGGLNIATGTTLQKMGSGTLRIGGPQNHGANTNLNILAGNVRLASNAGIAATGAAAATHNLAINVTGTNTALILESSTDVRNLTVPFANPGNQSMDLNTPAALGAFNGIRIYASDLVSAKSTLWAAIKNANAPGSTTPNDGIFDSGLAGHSASGIGLAQVPDAHGDQNIFIRATKIGDVNLDGNVSIADFLQLAGNFGNVGSATWQEGDLNYDGNVSIADFLALASNFNTSYSGAVTPISPSDFATLSSFASSFGADPAIIGSSVPEPGVLVMAGSSVLLLGCRRRRLNCR